MGFWNRLFGSTPNHAGVTANGNEPPPAPGTVGETGWTPGDPNGLEIDTTAVYSRSLPAISPSPWSGWPAGWSTPNWDFGSRFNELVDIAWACLDLNASVLAAMPPYRTSSGQVIEAETWMRNPDPMIYTSWAEFAKQLFWDFQLGEAFVLPMAKKSDGYPLTFRVVPPWMISIEMSGGSRTYRLGASGDDVTDEILHIRYKSSTDQPHGVGPLESAGGRMLTAGTLAKYVREIVSTGGVPDYTLETDQDLTESDAQDLLQQWLASRVANLGAPAVLDNGVELKAHMSMSPKDMAMLEISQFTEARIAVLLGVPPFLVGLPSGGSESMTYSNVSQIFDFHDRASLRTKATPVMLALSDWALPATQRIELNRDEYTRPPFAERAEAYERAINAGWMTPDEVRQMERLNGPAPARPAAALTGGEQ